MFLGTYGGLAQLALRLGISLSMLERFDEARSVFNAALACSPADSRLEHAGRQATARSAHH